VASIQALGSVSKVRGALIFVEDIEAELIFYRDFLGLRLLYRTDRFVRFDESAFVRPDADPERIPG
jgi:catechol 2,3-dioxygenase-like lactoylglutathione lyase family enzyme